VARHRYLRCASRRAPKGAVKEQIHCLGHRVPIGLFGRQQQAAANQSIDFTIAKLELIAAQAITAALVRAILMFATIGAVTLSAIGRFL